MHNPYDGLDDDVADPTPRSHPAPGEAPVPEPATRPTAPTPPTPPAPKPAATTTQATATPEATPDTDTDPAAKLYGRRRRCLKVAGIVAAIVAAFVLVRHTESPDPVGEEAARAESKLEPPTAAQMGEGSRLLESALASARTHRARTGAFSGFRATAPVLSAANADTVIASVANDGHCYFSAILAEKSPEVLVDPTFEACSATAIATAQEGFDAQTQLAGEAAVSEAQASLVDAAEYARFYANSNFENGRPSLKGVPTTLAPGVVVLEVAPDGSALRASARIDEHRCLVAVLGLADEEHSTPATPTPC